MYDVEKLREEVLRGASALGVEKDSSSTPSSAPENYTPSTIKRLIHTFFRLFDCQLVRLETLAKLEKMQQREMSKPGYIDFSWRIYASREKINTVFSLLGDNISQKALASFIRYWFSEAWLPLSLKFPFAGFPGNATVKAGLSSSSVTLPIIHGGEAEALSTLLYHVFVVEQYRIPGICEIEGEGIIVDAGCCLGETAVYFAQKAPSSIVYSFEPNPDMANLARKNIAANGLEEQIIVCPYALSDTIGTARFAASLGGGSNLNEHGAMTVDLTTIDEMAKQWERPVSFIKMDIEGAELAALQGAVETIHRDRPKLAISLYHKPEDLFELPFFLKEHCTDYSFFVRGDAEFVLFAVPNEKIASRRD
ncbi:MAG: hypothetical protein DELT_01092 [Desulfovibrio sp.]